MLKHIIKYCIPSLVLAGALISCDKNVDEPLQSDAANEPQLGFSMMANAQEPIEDNLRLASYDLVGDKKKMEINFLHIKNATPAQLQRSGVTDPANYNKVPVHLFFINTKIGVTSRRYYLKYMDIIGKNKLYLSFQDYPEVRRQFDQDNADHWYVKAFIGGFTSKQPNDTRENSESIYGIYYIMDNLFSCDTTETSYITRDMGAYPSCDPDNWKTVKYQVPLPFPMETPWRKVNFFYRGTNAMGDLSNNEASDYHDISKELEFQPLGSLMRLQLRNDRSKDLPVTVFHFSPAPIQTDGTRIRPTANPSNRELSHQIYVNAIVRKIDELPPHDPVTKHVTNEALTEALPGATTKIGRDGDVHYHHKRFTDPVGNNKHEVVYLKSGTSRTYFFWIFEDKQNNLHLQEAYVQPYFHNTFNSNNLTNDRHKKGTTVPNGNQTVPFQPIYLGSPANDHCIKVARNQYKNGRTYFIKSRLTDKP